jgi:hypothetical protein
MPGWGSVADIAAAGFGVVDATVDAEGIDRVAVIVRAI